jgi:hypothetical protein
MLYHKYKTGSNSIKSWYFCPYFPNMSMSVEKQKNNGGANLPNPVELNKMRVPQPQLERDKAPQNLDIIKIDGRWAQFAGGSQHSPIKYLDNEEQEIIDLDQYAGRRYHCMGKNIIYDETKKHRPLPPTVSEIQDQFTPQEIENIRWGPEQEKNPHLKTLVTVWGELEKIR